MMDFFLFSFYFPVIQLYYSALSESIYCSLVTAGEVNNNNQTTVVKQKKTNQYKQIKVEMVNQESFFIVIRDINLVFI